MKKLLTFLTLLTLFFTTAWAENATFVFGTIYSNVTTNQNVQDVAIAPSSGSNVSVTFTQETSQNPPQYYTSGYAIRFYKSNQLTVTANEGYIINSVTFTFTESKYTLRSDNITVSSGTYNLNSTTGTWSDLNANSATLLNEDRAARISRIVVEYEANDVQKYSITVNQPEGGEISADKAEAAEGATVTLTATPDLGYELYSWTVLDGNADEVTVTNNQFTMPASDVEVSATFSKTWNNIITNVIPLNCGGGIWVYSGTEFGGVKKAQVGDDIYIRVVTDENNTISFEDLTITDANNNTINYEPNGTDGWIWKDGRYGAEFKFVMPATAVTITAQYSVTRGTLRLAGRFNGNTAWRTTGTDEPAFTYDSNSDTYTIDAYFTGEGDGNYFYLTYDGAAKHPTADGNWSVQNTDGQATALTWSGNANFFIENGVFTIELPGNLSTIAFTKKNPTITFNPAAGAVESGTEVSAASNLTDFISSIKAGDAGAQGEVSVKLCTDNSSFNLDNVTITELTKVYGKAWISNIATPVSEATYTIKTIETVTPTYEESFSENFGKFTPDDETIWTIGSTSSASFAKATAYNTGLQPIESYLISPYINLTNCSNPKVSFSHAGNYFSNQENMMADVKVMIKKQSDAGWTPLNDVTYPNGKSWTFVDNETSLIDYAGEIIQIAFKYTAPEDRAGTWEIKNFKVEDAELTYTVTCVGTPSNGVNQFTTDKEEYEAGETVTITVSPKNGFELTSLSYTAEGGNANTIDLIEGQTEYSFEMPAANVTVNATFTALSYGITVVSDHGTHNCPTTGTTLSPISFTVEPEDGYVISSVTANPTTVAVTVSGNDISFIMPAVPVTLTINYTQQSSGTAIDLFHETFGDNSGKARDWNDSYSVKSGVEAVYSGITGYEVTNAKQGKNTTGSVLSGLNQSTSGVDAIIVMGPLNVADYENLVLTYQWKAASIKEDYSTSLYYKTNADGTYTEVSGTGEGATTFVERTYNLPAEAEVSTLYLKIVFNTSNTQAIIDEVNLAGTLKSVEPATEITLAGLESSGVKGKKYAISDDLVAVEYKLDGDVALLWCKDDNGATPIAPATGVVDFMINDGTQTAAWDQSNWVVIKTTDQAIGANFEGAKGKKISGVTGTYVDNVNYMIELDGNFTKGEDATANLNNYCVANFNSSNWGAAGVVQNAVGNEAPNPQPFFFMIPKVQEVCIINYAQWNGTNFVVPVTSGFTGELNVDYKYNSTSQADVEAAMNASLTSSEVDRPYYKFTAIVQVPTASSAHLKGNLTGGAVVYPTDFTAGEPTDPTTAISTVGVNGEVKSVKYVSVAGVVSDRPFQGVNIVVTEYSDGSRTTAKVVK